MVSNVSHWQTLQCSDFSRPHASLPSRTPGLLQPAVIEVLSIFIAGYSYCPCFLKRMRACCLQPPGVPCTSTVLWCMLAHTCHSRCKRRGTWQQCLIFKLTFLTLSGLILNLMYSARPNSASVLCSCPLP